MNDKQRQARLQRWGQYQGSAYRRWRVYTTFLTGFLIGLCYVLLISGRFFPGLGDEGQNALVLIFSGILGGVIYTIVVDEKVEMPRFVGGSGDQFEAGLFGDILLGIAGAVVLDYIRQQLGVELTSPSALAAAGIVGGYGGRAVLQFALTRVFKDINFLEADRQKYLQASMQHRMERMDSLKLIDQLNQQIRLGLASAELAELRTEIKQADSDVRKRAFNLVQEFRRSANVSGEISRIERTIPIFEALIESDPQHHPYYAELAFAYKDSGSPDLFQAIQYLDKAIALRGNQQRAETWNYELSRAITRIQEAYKASNTYDFEPAVHERIIADLLAVAEIYNLENILKEVSQQNLPVPVINWIQHNQSMLSAHPKASVLIEKLDSLIEPEIATAQPQEIAATSSKREPQQAAVILSASNTSSPTKLAANTAISKSAPIPIQPPIDDNAVPEAGIALIKEFEGYHKELSDGRVEAYPDAIHGWKVPTIGYGTTRYPDGRKVQQGDIITRDEAERYLLAEVEHSCKGALQKIPSWKQMNINQRAALYSFAYNLGANFYGNSRDFSSITLCCDSSEKWSDKTWIESQFVKYRNPGTSAEVGLRRRRLAEANLFCKPGLNTTPDGTTGESQKPKGRTSPEVPISLAGVMPLMQMEADAVRWVKKQLAHGGYYTGKIDGIVDELMLSAFKSFKAAFFLNNPDQISPDTLKVLANLQAPTSESDIMLSQNFKLSELIFSETAAREDIDNYPHDEAVIENLKAVCQKVLEPVRSHFNKPITPSSGYRGKALNTRIKGSLTSQHMVGEAVDFVVPGVSIPEACDWISNNLEFDQLIMEFYNPHNNSGWIHCSYRRNGGNRRQFFTIS